MPVFRVTPPYLHLLVTTRLFFFGGGGGGQVLKKYYLCILKDEMPFKMHEIVFFPEKIKIKKV